MEVVFTFCIRHLHSTLVTFFLMFIIENTIIIALGNIWICVGLSPCGVFHLYLLTIICWDKKMKKKPVSLISRQLYILSVSMCDSTT